AAGGRQWQDACCHLLSGEEGDRPPEPDILKPERYWVFSPALALREGRLKAEYLRARAGPSLTELLAKRSGQAQETEQAVGLALALSRWDRAAGLPLLTALEKRCRDEKQTRLAVRILGVRLDAGDPAAPDDFATWLRSLPPEQFAADRWEDPCALLGGY